MGLIGTLVTDNIQKGKIHCGCGLCKFGKKYGLPAVRGMRERSRENSYWMITKW